jgi:protein-S-isoprenylcysteine O-methyltransferase Ste14
MTMEKSDQPEHPANAEVVFHPPFLVLLFISLGLAARWLAPAEFFPLAWALFVGPILVVASLGLFLWAAYTLHRGGASIPTNEPTNSLVVRGPFRFSRNPIYLGMVTLLLGVGIWANSLWFIGLAALAVLFLNWGVISPEERYLGRKFGEEYLTYKGRVRRWC